MINILFDHQAFSWQQFGGITRYIIELSRHLPADTVPMFPPMLSENAYLDMLPDNIAPVVSRWDFSNFRVRKKLYEYLNRFHTVSIIKKQHPDILHPTYYNPYYLRYKKIPTVITVHDFTHERFPSMLSDSRSVIENKRRTVKAADRIIAISESTKRDLMEFYNLPEERIDVIYHGYTPMSTNNNAVNIPSLPEHYVLFVGERGPYKNFATFAKAFAQLTHSNPELKLVCAGKLFKTSESEFLKHLNLTDRTIAFPAYGNQLATLYRNASAFIFPSLYEGFGLPVLEAFSACCPTGLSNTSSLPEVGGDGALYFDPKSADDIAATIDQLLRMDNKQRLSLINNATAQLSKFSWEKTGKQTAEIYRSLK